jgi:hypothetical protein
MRPFVEDVLCAEISIRQGCSTAQRSELNGHIRGETASGELDPQRFNSGREHARLSGGELATPILFTIPNFTPPAPEAPSEPSPA